MGRRSLAVLGTSCLAIGCGAEVGGPEESVGEARDGIINGTPVDPEGGYHVDVRHVTPTLGPGDPPFRRCSGTLIRNDMVLTARHCVTTTGEDPGLLHTDLSKYELVIGSQSSGVREIIDVMGGARDVALLVADEFFSVASKTTGWNLPIYAGSSSTLVGVPLYCAGYGVSTLDGGFGDSGTLRYAWLAPNAATAALELQYLENANDQIMWRGDSGGTCVYTGVVTGSTLAVTGVNDYCYLPSGPCYQVAPEAFRTQVAAALLARAASAVHVVTTANLYSGYWSRIQHPDANSKPNALLTVTPNWNPPEASGGYNNAPIGVWYDGSRWNVFNENYASMGVNRAFNISVGGASFVHQATAANTGFHITTIDRAGLNGNPSASFQVTQNWNPGGVGGTYNPHTIGVWYDTFSSRWTIYNEDLATMPIGASFNVRTDDSKVVQATPSKLSGNTLFLDDPLINGRPEARVFVTHNYTAGHVYLTSPLGVWYNSVSGRWGIFRQDGLAMPTNAGFNVLIRP